MTEKVLLGFTSPAGKRYHFRMHHIVITGITQLSGKSTTVETVLKRRKGKSLVFLTKRGEKIFQDARRIQPFYKERFDWEYVRSLLQAAWREKMKFETPWIIRIAKHTKSLVEFRKALNYELEHKKLREFDRNVYMVLAAYLDKILPVLEQAKEKFTDRLELKPGMNIMDLTEWYTHEEVQMVVIRACMEWILEKENDVTVALPEAWKMLPQTRNTPVKLYFEKFIREGATNGNYLIIDAQDLGGVDKTPLRQVNVWIMGRMKEAHEVARLLKQTLGLKMKPEVIQTLPLGHFIVAEEKVEKVYVWAHGVPEDVARKVARGELAPEYVRDHYLKREKEDEDEMYKEKWEEEKRKREEVEREFAKQLERLSDLKAKEKVEKEKSKRVRAIMDMERARKDAAAMDKEVERLAFEVKDLRRFKEIGESAEELRKAFTKFLRLDEKVARAPGFEPGSSISLEHKELVIKLHDKGEKEVKMSTSNKEGQILFCAVKDLPKEGWTTGDINKALNERGWPIKSSTLSAKLSILTGRGLLVKTKVGYRLPTKVKFNITKV